MLRVDKKAAAAGRAAARPSRASRSSTSGGSRRCATSRSQVRAGRDRGHRGRRRQRADGAHRRPDRPPAASSRADPWSRGKDVTGAPRARCSTRASATSPRIASCGGSCSTSRSPRTSRCTTSSTSPTRASAGSIPRRLIERAAACCASSTCGVGGPTTLAASLSGGNQQKVVVAREVSRDPSCSCRAAHPRPGRRRHRVRPPPARPGTGRGPRDPARLLRARRDPLALRPDPRHLRGSHRGRVPTGRLRGGARHRHDGRWTGGGRVMRAGPESVPTRPARSVVTEWFSTPAGGIAGPDRGDRARVPHRRAHRLIQGSNPSRPTGRSSRAQA